MTIARCLLVACVCLLPMGMGCGGSEKKDDKPADSTAAAAKPAGCACPGEGTTCACGKCKDGAGCVCGK